MHHDKIYRKMGSHAGASWKNLKSSEELLLWLVQVVRSAVTSLEAS